MDSLSTSPSAATVSLLATSPPTAELAHGNAFDPESWRAAPYAAHRPSIRTHATYIAIRTHAQEILEYADLQDRSPAPGFGLRKRETMALDVGCGPAQTALGLVATYRFDRVVGVDPSETMCRQASRMTHEMRANGELPTDSHVHFIRGVVEALSWLPDGEVDVIASSNSCQWWLDRTKAWAEFRRTLKPGGVVALWCYTDAMIPTHPKLSHIITSLTTDLLGPYWVQPARGLVTDMFEAIALPDNEPNEHEDEQYIEDHGHWDMEASRRIRFDVLPEDCWTPPPSILPCEHRKPILRASWTIDDISAWISTLSSTILYEKGHPGERPVAERAAVELRAAAGADANMIFECYFPMAMLYARKSRC